MNITRVNSSSNTNVLLPRDNNAIKILEQQKMQLQEQIQKTSESKIDDKTKQDRIKQLRDQIQQIDMEIQQRQAEELNQNDKSTQQTSNNQTFVTGNEDSISLSGISDLVQVSSTYSQIKTMNNTRANLNGKGRVLKIEIELDEKKGGEAKLKRAELQKIESRKRSLDKKIGETMEKTENQINEASEKTAKYKEVYISKEEDIISDKNFKTSISNSFNIQNTNLLSNRDKNSNQNKIEEFEQKNYNKIDIIV